MNILKLQKDFLTSVIKKKNPTYAEWNNMVGYGSPAFIGFIHKSDAYVDPKLRPRDMKRIMDEEQNHPYVIGNRIYTITLPDKRKCARFENGEQFCYLNESFLSYFDKDAVYYINDEKTPVFVHEYGHTVGVILPVRI